MLLGRRLETFDRSLVVVECEAGLANRLRTIAEQRHRRSRASLAVLWLRNGACPGSFSSVFQPPPESVHVTVYEVESEEQRSWQRHAIESQARRKSESITACNDAHLKGHESKRHGPKEVVALYSSLFRLVDPLQRRVDAFDTQHRLSRCVGVHLRTSDRATFFTTLSQRVSGKARRQSRDFAHDLMATMASRVRGLLEAQSPLAANPGRLAASLEKEDTRRRQRPRCIFLATDSDTTAAQWRELSAQWNVTLIQHVPEKADAIAASPASGARGDSIVRATGVADAAVDLHLLARCGWFLGTVGSSFSVAVTRLRWRPIERMALVVPEPTNYWSNVKSAYTKAKAKPKSRR